MVGDPRRAWLHPGTDSAPPSRCPRSGSSPQQSSRSPACFHIEAGQATDQPPPTRHRHDGRSPALTDGAPLTLRGVAFPIYAAENWRAQIGSGWGTLAQPSSAQRRAHPSQTKTLITIDGTPEPIPDPTTRPSDQNQTTRSRHTVPARAADLRRYDLGLRDGQRAVALRTQATTGPASTQTGVDGDVTGAGTSTAPGHARSRAPSRTARSHLPTTTGLASRRIGARLRRCPSTRRSR
jgi:hypothetical protein